MTENQKLREALLSDMDIAVLRMPVHLAFAGNMAQFQYHNRVQALLARIEALALPTDDHLPDAGEMVVDHFPDATKMIETAAPVGEREAFEQVIVEAVGSGAIRRWPNEKGESYENARVQDYRQGWLWGIEWQARAALIAGDALDAARYRWLMDNCTLGIKQNGVGWSLNTSACVAPDCIKDVGAAIDASMRKDKP